jgi:uncharacterized damage-inducible protein DinB
MKPFLTQFTAYNVWANTEFAKVLRSLEPSVLDKEVVSSFPSLRKTVTHIWDAELIWLSRMRNQGMTWPPSAAFVNPAIDEFINTSKSFDEFVRLEDEDFLKASTTYKNSKGHEFTNTNAGIITHCMNHGSFHRGQLVTMFRVLGLSPIPNTDMIGFLRMAQ